MASPLSLELKVGMFVVSGCLLLVLMSAKLGNFFLAKERTYDIEARFENLEGLDKGGSVQIAGVTVGRVKEIRLDGSRARVVLELQDGIVLKKDAAATIKTKGVLGEKFVEIDPGIGTETIAKQGGAISNEKRTVGLEQLMARIDSVVGDIKEVTTNLRKSLGGPEGEQMMRGIVKNLYELSGNLNRVVAKNDENLTRTIRNLEVFSAVLAEKTPDIAADLKLVAADLREVLADNKGNLRTTMENVKGASEKLDKAIASLGSVADKLDKGQGTLGRLINDDSVYKSASDAMVDFKASMADFKTASSKLDKTLGSLTSVSDKIDKGQGTLGKLINDDTVHENMNKALAGINKVLTKGDQTKTYFDFRTEFMPKTQASRTEVNLRVQPKQDYYYLVGVSDNSNGSFSRRTDVVSVNGGPPTTTVTETEEKKRVSLNAQIGKRFHDLEVSGGLFSSTGGVSAAYYAASDKLKLSVEAYDFDKKYAPHVTAGVRFNALKYFFLTGGIDDIASDRGRASAFVGAGLKFEDDDIKYLLSSMPLPTK